MPASTRTASARISPVRAFSFSATSCDGSTESTRIDDQHGEPDPPDHPPEHTRPRRVPVARRGARRGCGGGGGTIVVVVSVTDLTTQAAWMAGLAIVVLLLAGWRKNARAAAQIPRSEPTRRKWVPIGVAETTAPLYKRPSIFRRIWAIVASSGLAIVIGVRSGDGDRLRPGLARDHAHRPAQAVTDPRPAPGGHRRARRATWPRQAGLDRRRPERAGDGVERAGPLGALDDDGSTGAFSDPDPGVRRRAARAGRAPSRGRLLRRRCTTSTRRWSRWRRGRAANTSSNRDTGRSTCWSRSPGRPPTPSSARPRSPPSAPSGTSAGCRDPRRHHRQARRCGGGPCSRWRPFDGRRGRGRTGAGPRGSRLAGASGRRRPRTSGGLRRDRLARRCGGRRRRQNV